MQTLPTTNDYHTLVIENKPLIDVRAPVEFKAGAFPNTVNMPIMDDEDRHLVGVCYKQNGRDAAFNLAFERVSGEKREQRITAWEDFINSVEEAFLYCFRGGMRSKTAQQWLVERTGKTILRLEGGYKSFRRYLINSMQPENIAGTPVILGGRTGTGKTILLRNLKNSIDLEAIAHHRGSTFGAYISPQPSQINFENRLAYALIQHQHKGHRHIVLEDEGSYIGARYIPHELVNYFKRDSMVLLECELEERIEITFEEYVVDAQRQYVDIHGAGNGMQLWFGYMQSRIHRIRKRLGGLRLKKVMAFLEDAHAEQQRNGDAQLHKRWIRLLLTEYYDPMYDYQIEKSGRAIDFQGNFDEVKEYLQVLENNL